MTTRATQDPRAGEGAARGRAAPDRPDRATAALPRLSADRVKDILIVDDHPLMCDALALTHRST